MIREQSVDLKGQVAVKSTQVFTIDKSHRYIGLSISGGADSRYQREIRVVTVNPNSASALAGLDVGMVVLFIDDTPLEGLTHNEVCQLIRRTFKNKKIQLMKMTVAA
jgi:C-terminal processing protease CtpA/Prc